MPIVLTLVEQLFSSPIPTHPARLLLRKPYYATRHQRLKDCMTSWVVPYYVTLGGSLGGGSFVIRSNVRH